MATGLFSVFSFLLLCINLAAESLNPHLRGQGQIKIPDQVLVFDAGSSGTRLHVFNIYPSEDPNTDHVPKVDLAVRDEQTKKVKPGLATLAKESDLDGVGRSVKELLKFADDLVPKERRHHTPLLLKATAGMRAVKPELAEAVLQRVRKTFSESAYRFQNDWAGIIKGREEGGLAWVAVNYLRGTFDPRTPQPSMGVIEMGGGSTQVAFEVLTSDVFAPEDEFHFFTAQGIRYRVYAHSYLGFGLDYARETMQASLPKDRVFDPCYPVGRLMGKVEGSGDSEECLAAINSRLLNVSLDGPGRYSRELPLKAGFYAATENFIHVQNDLSMELENKPVNHDMLQKKAEKGCSIKISRAGSDLKKVNACFGLVYEAAFLQALRASERNADTRVVRKIRGADIDWALGAAIVHFLQGHALPHTRGHWEDDMGLHSSQLTLGFLTVVGTGIFVFLVGRRICAGQVSVPVLNSARPTKIGMMSAE